MHEENLNDLANYPGISEIDFPLDPRNFRSMRKIEEIGEIGWRYCGLNEESPYAEYSFLNSLNKQRMITCIRVDLRKTGKDLHELSERYHEAFLRSSQIDHASRFFWFMHHAALEMKELEIKKNDVIEDDSEDDTTVNNRDIPTESYDLLMGTARDLVDQVRDALRIKKRKNSE